MLAAWIVNWILHCTLKNYLHLMLSFVFSLELVYLVIGYSSIEVLNRSDAPTALSGARIGLFVILELGLLTFLIICANGYLIVTRTFAKGKIVIAVVYSIFLIVPLILSELFSFERWDFVVVALCLLGILLYYQAILAAIHDATAVVLGHLLLIARSGIIVETTPIYAKFRMFKAISWLVVLYFVFVCVLLGLNEMGDAPFWVTDCLKDVLNILVIGVAGVVFRLTKAMNEGYQMVALEEDGAEIGREEIEGLTVDSHQLRQGQKRWEEGMELPPQPRIVESDADSAPR
jgi:hypothetical protein